jgi:hypothetical protein
MKKSTFIGLKKRVFLAGTVFLVLGCGLIPGLGNQPISPTLPTTTQVPMEPIDLTQTTDPLAACPKPTGETQLYVNLDDGYCLLYPNGFTVQATIGIPPLPTLNITGAQVITPGPKQQEGSFNAAMSIVRNGPPEGMDSQTYVAQWLERFAPSMSLPQDAITIGGIPAVRVRNIPSYGSVLGAFVVSPFARYSINLTPEPEFSDPALANQANLVWNTVVNSLVFFEPQKDMGYISSPQVCPQAREGEIGYINQIDGYCMVYPSDFGEDPIFPGRIIGGPILGDTADFKDVQTNLMVGTFGIANGQSPRDYLSRLPEGYYDPASIADMTIGNSPAVVYTNLAGPWKSRNAFIVLPGGGVYTIVSQPDDFGLFPEGVPYLNRLFNSVEGSLQFFTPWR